ncbi:MAG TPA: hypothetical protein V6C85_18995 [Allocoleopsis sp.]
MRKIKAIAKREERSADRTFTSQARAHHHLIPSSDRTFTATRDRTSTLSLQAIALLILKKAIASSPHPKRDRTLVFTLIKR